MRSQVAVPVVCAVLGGAVTAATLLASGAVEPGSGSVVVQSTTPLFDSSPVGGTAAGDIYRREGAGVVAVTARTVSASASAFDAGMRSADGGTEGSGFVLNDDGEILTAAHLVRAGGDIHVLVGGRRLTAKVEGIDDANDLALLRVDTDGLAVHPLTLGDSDAVQVGDPAVAMGRAPGLEPSLAVGTVAARQPRVSGQYGAAVVDALQTDVPLRPNDCGGPLLDAAGRVVGVNIRMMPAEGGDPIQLAVPVNTARDVIARLENRTMKVVGG
jgi:putative serine protease PepD